MADEIIKARVWQKIDTEENWNANPLILGPGEAAFVVTSSGAPVNFKLGDGTKTFAQLPWYFDWGAQAGIPKAADTATVFPPGEPGFYLPTEDGTYDGVTVDLSDGVNYLIWDGTTLTKVVFPIDLAGYALEQISGRAVVRGAGAKVGATEVDSTVLTPPQMLSVGTNKFNKDAVTPNTRINSLGVIENNNDYSTSDFIEVDEGVEYARYQNSPVAFFNEFRVFISGITSVYFFTPPPGSRYVRTSFLTDSLDAAYIKKRSDGEFYEPYHRMLKNDIVVDGETLVARSVDGGQMKLSTVNKDVVDFISTGVNKFNKDAVTPNTRINSLGVIENNNDFFTSDYIRVEPGEYRANWHQTPKAYFDEKKAYISGQTSGESITVPAGADFMRMSFPNERLVITQIVEGDELLPYEPYYEKLKYGRDSGQSVEDIPQYAIDAIRDAREAVFETTRNKNMLTFTFITDTHVGLPGNNLVSEATAVRLTNQQFVDFLVFGGDAHDATGTSYDEALRRIGLFKEVFDKCTLPVYYVRGNHDVNYKFNGASDALLSSDFYNLYSRKVIRNVNANPNDPFNNYYYVDYPEYKIRVAILQSNDSPSEYYNIAAEQLAFIENEILDISNDWGVLFFIHFYYDSQGIAPKLMPVLNSFQSNGGTIIAVISGHLHVDGSSAADGYLNIYTTCSLNTIEQAGSIDEIAFDVFSIDTDERKIFAHRVGRGNSRSFDY